MIRIIPVPITIAVSGTSFDSEVQLNPESLRMIAYEFTTPNYTNSVTSTISIVSSAGRTLHTSSAIAKATAHSKICTEDESAPIMSGFKVHVELGGAAGGATPYTLTALLYVTDDSSFVNIPTGFVNVISFEHQTALLDQASPVQNTWYTILDTTSFCKCFGIAVMVADTTETLEVRITADGHEITGSGSCTNDQSFKALINTIATGHSIALSTSSLITANQIEARSFKVEVRKTTAAGAGNLKGCVAYCQRG